MKNYYSWGIYTSTYDYTILFLSGQILRIQKHYRQHAVPQIPRTYLFYNGKSLLIDYQCLISPSTQLLVTALLLDSSMNLTILVSTQGLSSFARLISRGIMFSRFIHCGINAGSLIFILIYREKIVHEYTVYYTFETHSFVKTHLGCVYALATANPVTLIGLWTYPWKTDCFSFGYLSEMGLTDCRPVLY